MVFVTGWSVYYAVASAWKRCERSLTHGPADVGNRPGKGAAGWNPTWDIPHTRPPSVPHGKEFMFTSTRDPLCADLLWPLQGHVPTRTTMRSTFHQVVTQAIQAADNNLLSVLRRISLPKSMITLWTPSERVGFERACQKAVISATVMALYGVLSPGTFQNAAQPFSPPPPLAYEYDMTCGSGLLRSSLSLNVF